MKHNVKLISVFVTLLFTASVNANWTQSWGKIKEVMSHDGVHIVYTTITDAVCGQNGNFWWSKDDPGAQDMYAMALAA